MKRYIILGILIALTLNMGMVFANGDDDHTSDKVVFPAWTYYAEIVEHSLMAIIGIVAIIFLINPYKKSKGDMRKGIIWMIMGLLVFIFAQILTNFQHYLIYPFGIWTAIMHHGAYLASTTIILLAFFKVLGSKE